MSVCVISAEGKPLMPTSDYRCRRLLKSGKAVIHQHRPFTIRLTRTVSEGVQHYGEYVSLDDGTSVAVSKVRKVIHTGGYVRIG